MPRSCYCFVPFVLIFVLAACGMPGGAVPTASPAPPTLTADTAPTPTAAPTATSGPAAVSSFADVRSAVVRIVARGSFVQPGDFEAQNFAGQGSGFIIDPAGIAVTNNHVVTGAALLEVFVGDETEPRNARVLGVSECSDLAVIDIDGDDFPFLEWFAGEVTAGQDVRAVGFPLGDTEFTVNQGIVSKARADGETPWASVDNVIEHDVTIRPGNSGGPLVTRDTGQVLAINYAGFAGGPYYAIGRDEALPLIDQLRTGANVTSIGINAVAINTGEISGVWVSSVASGSPADQARIQPGDFITALEGLILATDGTMADYCDILRTRTPEAVMNVEVARINDSGVTFLEGQINGRELEAVGDTAFTPPASPTAAAPPTTTPPETAVSPLPTFDAVQLQQARDSHIALRNQFGQVIFETFDRGNVTRASWREGEDSSSIARLRGNLYELTLKQPNALLNFYWLEGSPDGTFGANYIFELDTAFGSPGQDGGVGIAFDGQPNRDGSAFLIRSDGTWQVLTFVNGALAPALSSDPLPTGTIIDGVNQVRVVRLADQVEFWINNTPVGLMTPGPFNSGFGGVAVLSGPGSTAPVTLLADNFRALE